MRRALCVGIDEYNGNSLTACAQDAERMSELLATHEDSTPNFDCRKLLAPAGGGTTKVTRSVLREALSELFGTATPVEVALFYFSGHGAENNLDGYLVTQDANKYDEGVAMGEVLKLANTSSAEEVVIILDCCHSGIFGTPPTGTQSGSLLREGISILTASRGDQPSVEAGGSSLFTSLAADALQGGAADLLGNVTASGLYACVEAALGAWDQRPLFKAHVQRMVSLRHCRPPVPLTTLRELTSMFPLPAEDLRLSPQHEGSDATAQPEKVEVFRKLQDLNRIHLVVPVEAAHMYDAAVGGKACRLTPSGRLYWRLAKAGRI